MEQKLVVVQKKNLILSALYEEKRLVQVLADPVEPQALVGSIYLGKVKNIVKNINAAFVEIAPGQMCYLALGTGVVPISRTRPGSTSILAGDELIVQIDREAIKTKLASVTCEINLSGKYAVLIHGKKLIGISSKITEPEKRKQLKEIFASYQGESYGFIVRTNAMEATEEELKTEITYLIQKYEKLCREGIYRSCFTLLDKPLPAYISSIRDHRTSLLSSIVTEDKNIYEEIREYLVEYQPQDIGKLTLHTGAIALGTLYSLDSRIKEALNKHVWLKSGASLVIEPTEALTVIDVNTGKAIDSRKRGEDYFLQINLEAAKEIAKQIRLRNYSGIIVADFIDLESKEANSRLMSTLSEELAKDPVKTTVVDMTPLHLVEITRKKVRKPLHEMGLTDVLG